jgi:hypothetical protein
MNLNEIVTKGDLILLEEKLIEEIKKIRKTERPSKWIRSVDVRNMLSISQGTLQNLRINGELPYAKIGSIYFYNINDINMILEKNKFQNK